ncbi:VIR protein [Plasmodium vivax]|uniref:VIR protein n=1 Tax=Plasmodium vivax TaxID=5855 RepID=A0A1G4E5Z3_PLAVI|nr:VIR protein [Plasmodium vivax]
MEEHNGAKYATLILKDSSPYILYNKFNRNNIEDKDIHYCVDKFQLRTNEELYNLCKMFEKNLSELPTIMRTEEDNKQHCRYLTFWINDKIRNNFKTHNVPNDDHNYIVQGFFSVSNFVNNGLPKIHCNYDYNRDITMDIWKKWKDLYDYIINRNHIQKVINTSKDLCEKYSTYYSYIKEIYSDYEKECCIKQYGNCPEYLDFREWCNDDNVLNKLSCAHSHHDDATPVKSPEDVAGEEQVAEEASEGNKEDKGQQAQSQGIGGEALSVGSEGGLFLTEIDVRGGHLDTEVTEYLGNKQFGMEDNNGEPSNHNAFNPARTITYTSLGLVLPLVTLYRFTPLGSCVNTRILGKNELMDNMKRNHYELLLNDVRNGEMSLNDTTYSISYNSASK